MKRGKTAYYSNNLLELIPRIVEWWIWRKYVQKIAESVEKDLKGGVRIVLPTVSPDRRKAWDSLW